MNTINSLQTTPTNCSGLVFSVNSNGRTSKINAIVAGIMEDVTTPITETGVLLEELAVRLVSTKKDSIELSDEEHRYLHQCLKAVSLPAWVKAKVNERLLVVTEPEKA